MKRLNVFTRYSSCITFLLGICLLGISVASAQSTDPARPTPISGFPLTGRLAAGTYYYAVPVSAGPGTMGLQMTPPIGGSTMSASLSGPDCCTADAYVSADSGTSDTIRRASEPFTVPSAQTLLVTINIAVARGDTVRFTLNLGVGGGSGIIITPPPSPTPAPTPSGSGIIITPPSPTGGRATPSGGVCTDLGVDFYTVNNLTDSSKRISGVVRNYTGTHPFKSSERGQWLQVFDITDSAKDPVRLLQVRIPAHLDPGAVFAYRTVHSVSGSRRTRYQIKIVYGHWLDTDRSQYNDDCNAANDSTTRQLITGTPDETGPVLLEKLPKP